MTLFHANAAFSVFCKNTGVGARYRGQPSDRQLAELALDSFAMSLQPWQHDPALRLVLSLLVLVTDFALFIGLEEKHLAQTFVSIDFRR